MRTIKRRIMNEQLAALVARLRHGDMIYIGDAGSAVNEHSLYPLADNVEYINLASISGCPTVEDVVEALTEAMDFESAILPAGFDDPNDEGSVPEFFEFMREMMGGPEYVHTINYAPEMYDLRNRCTAMIQTGDMVPGHIVILIAGWPSSVLDIDVLMGKKMYVCTAEEIISMPLKEFKEKYRSEE